VRNGYHGQRKMRPRDRRLRERVPVAPRTLNLSNAAERLELPFPERPKPPAGEPPCPLRDAEKHMWNHREYQSSGRQVGPEENLPVSSNSPLEIRPGVVVARGNLVQDAACWGINTFVARPTQSKREIDVLVIRAEGGIERADFSERFGPIESARAARA